MQNPESFPSRRDVIKQAGLAALLFMVWRGDGKAGEGAAGDFPWTSVLPVLLPLSIENPQQTFFEIAAAVNGELDARMPDLKRGFLRDLAGLIAPGGEKLTPEKIMQALRQMEANPRFPDMLAVAVRHCFRHPAIWSAIGYQGSSVEYGGYLERGFNDISWL